MNLQTLDLSCNFIGDAGAKILAEGLQHCKNQAALNRSQNIILFPADYEFVIPNSHHSS